MIKILTIDTEDRRLARRFLELPFRLYHDVPQWVPPLAVDARRMLNRRANPFFTHSDAAFLLAESSPGDTVGRLAVLENRNYNSYNGEHTAFFYLFECEDNLEAAAALFEAACTWARARQLDRMVGPKGFSALDGLGMLVEGFAHRPALGIPYNHAYYPRLVEAAGFRRQGELVSGYLSPRAPFPERVHELSALVQRRRGLRIERYRTRRDLRRLVPRLRELYNSSLSGTTGNVPLTKAEVQTLADQILWFADPRLIKIVMKEEEPVGFLFAYPDISAAMQRTRGRLWPFGWLDLWLELRRTRWVNVNGAGIIDKYRGLGGTAILFSEMRKSIVEGRFEHADIVQIGVENDRMQRELRELGIDFYKRHRLYERAL